MAPPDTDNHREIWSEINDTKQQLAKHLGECSVRHAEIIRRHDDSMRDRHGVNLKLDEMRTMLSAVESRMLLMWLSVAGGVIVVIVSVILQFALRK